MDINDPKYMRRAIQVSQDARDHGNHPFGAILVDEDGNIVLEAENNIITTKDCTGHAETNLMRKASAQFSPDFLNRCTLYTSTEPCAMCCGAIFWGGVRRMVFGLSMERLYAMNSALAGEQLYLSSRDLFKHGTPATEVIGPVLEDEALRVHLGFWG